ncbi:YnbE family lipoprotein [Novosphingobium sp.]|uniref:YnbE family lipoprotein n=1 Tax=Novosphingobium sp. TaxID=1874826 RepID=UPI003341BE69
MTTTRVNVPVAYLANLRGSVMSRCRPVVAKSAVGIALVMGSSGCITVKTPEKPIVIELNINIKTEVLYRLASDANQTIDKNAEIF